MEGLDFETVAGNLKMVRELIRRGVDINVRDKYGETLLHCAAFQGHLDVAKLLVESGADVDARDKDGWTPLHCAAFQGHLDVAKLLVESGANINTRNNRGETPLHCAAFWGKLDVAKLLVESGADVDAVDNYGQTPLDLAKRGGYREIVRLLESARQERPLKLQHARPQPEKPQPAVSRSLIASVEAPQLVAGEWGYLRVSLGGRARVSVEGEVDWLDPGEAEGPVEVPVRLKKAGKVPIVLVVRGSGREERRVVWLEAAEPRAERATLSTCPKCGAPLEPGANYCWRCGAKL